MSRVTLALAVVVSMVVGTGRAQGPKPVIAAEGGVVNGAGFQRSIAAGSWVTVFGQNLAPRTRIWRNDEIVNGILPKDLDGVSVRINEKPAAVYFISPTQLNVQAPDDTSVGAVRVQVSTREGGTSDAVTAQLQRVSPAFFMLEPEGRRYVAAVHADGTLLGKRNLFSNATTRPARPGDVILLFGTGFGPTTPAVAAGQAFSGAAKLSDPVSVRIGEVNAEVLFGGLSGAGLYQFNVRVPNVTEGDRSVVAEIGGVQTQAGAFLSVEAIPKPAIETLEPGESDRGETFTLRINGQNLGGATQLEMSPPAGVTFRNLEAQDSVVTAEVTIEGNAVTGTRVLTLVSPGNRNTHIFIIRPRLDPSFVISNLRAGPAVNTSAGSSLPITVDFSDPLGAISSGPVRLFIDYAGFEMFAPDGRLGLTPGTRTGTVTMTFSVNLRLPTGRSFPVRIWLEAAPGERRSNDLSGTFESR